MSTHWAPRVGDIAFLWPAGGFALSMLLVAPNRLWLPFLGAAFLADVVHAETLTHALQKSLGYATVYFTCMLLASLTLRRVVGVPVRLDSVRRVMLFVLIAPLGGNLLGAASGSFVSMVFDQQAFLPTFRVWWVSDALSILLIAPLVLAWSEFRPSAFRQIDRKRAAEALICFTALILVSNWAFTAQPVAGGGVPPLMHFIVPFLVWAALRFGTRGQSAAVILLAGISIWDTMHGSGPFSAAFVAPGLSVLYLQMFLMVAALMTLTGSALMRERQLAQSTAEEWKLRYEAAVVSAGNVLYDMDLDTREVVWGGNTRDILGFEPGEVGNASAWLSRVHPDDLGKIESQIDGTGRDEHETRTLEYRVRRENGTYIDVEDTGRVVRPPEGRAVRAIGFLKDVTKRNRAEAERERLDRRNARGAEDGGPGHHGRRHRPRLQQHSGRDPRLRRAGRGGCAPGKQAAPAAQRDRGSRPARQGPG